MAESRKCSKCGAELPPGAPDGFCPLCMIKAPLSAESLATSLDARSVHRQPPIEQVGETIGPYKLLEKIGEGGSGVVFVAEQQKPVRRQVALKIIKLGLDTEEVMRRFEAERQALALMEHPNIAKVFDAGTTSSGRPYFVMELVKGERITEYCDNNNLTTRQRLDLFVQICRATLHAHQKGIIHRAIKPSNILVSMQVGAPVVKVTDLGIAKAMEQRLTERSFVASLGDFAGTPAYMSPEQVETTGMDIDTRSDIYSLGIVMYELLTGTTPFDPKELQAKGIEAMRGAARFDPEELLAMGMAAMRRAVHEEEPQKPSVRLKAMDNGELTTIANRRQTAGPKLAHFVRGDLDSIVMKCLEKDRTQRYETVNELASDILRHVHDQPVLARPPSAAYWLQKAWLRNKPAFAGAALIVAVVAAVIGISDRRATLARRAEVVARQSLVESQANETLTKHRQAESQAVSKFLTEVFRNPDLTREGRSITVAESLAAASKKLETEFTNQPGLQVKLQAMLGSNYYALGLAAEAVPLQEKVRDYYLAASGQENPDTLQAMNDLANSYFQTGRRDEALKLRERVLAIRLIVSGSENPATLTTMIDLATSYEEAGRRNEALKLREDALALRRKVLGPEHLDTLIAMNDLANSCEDLGRRDEALKLREDVVALRRKALGPEHPDTLAAMNKLANSYALAGRRDEALRLREEVLALYRKVLGPEHPDTIIAMHNLAVSYDEAGRRDEALKLREQVLPLYRKIIGAEHPDTIMAINNLANSYAQAGRNEEALKLREEALALFRKVLGPEHPDTLMAMHNLAASYDATGRRDDALKQREEALALLRKVLGSAHPSTLGTIEELAASYEKAGRSGEAVKLREEVLAIRRKVLGPEHHDTLEAMNALAWTLATSDAPDIRNGTNAVNYAEEDVSATHRTNAGFLDTLAAAYAEAQQFDKAVATQQEAMGLLQSEQEKKDYDSRLKLYQANKPFQIQANP
jgi:eukaryotic-like serine/threonine-protein kinase